MIKKKVISRLGIKNSMRESRSELHLCQTYWFKPAKLASTHQHLARNEFYLSCIYREPRLLYGTRRKLNVSSIIRVCTAPLVLPRVLASRSSYSTSYIFPAATRQRRRQLLELTASLSSLRAFLFFLSYIRRFRSGESKTTIRCYLIARENFLLVDVLWRSRSTRLFSLFFKGHVRSFLRRDGGSFLISNKKDSVTRKKVFNMWILFVFG